MGGYHRRVAQKLLVVGDKAVVGPAGDVLQFFKATDAEGYYVPNALMEAQFALAHVYEAQAHALDPDLLFALFGSLNVPKRFLSDFRTRLRTFDETVHALDAEDGLNVHYQCSKDSMSHHNKGIVGLRLEFVTDVALDGVAVSGLENVGLVSQFFDKVCKDDPVDYHLAYKGSDVRGVTMSYVGDVRAPGETKVSDLRSHAGDAIGAELRTNVLATDLGDVTFERIMGADFDRSHTLVMNNAMSPDVTVDQRRKLVAGDGCPFARAHSHPESADASGCPFLNRFRKK